MSTEPYTARIVAWEYTSGTIGWRPTEIWRNFINDRFDGRLLAGCARVNEALSEYNAVFDSEIFTGKQYVKFGNEEDMTMFLLRYA